MNALQILNVFLIIVAIAGSIASPIMGIIRGVQNRSVGHALGSYFVPFWGLIYFFAAKKQTPQPENPAYIEDIKNASRLTGAPTTFMKALFEFV